MVSVPLEMGVDELRWNVVDLAGNVSTFSTSITRDDRPQVVAALQDVGFVPDTTGGLLGTHMPTVSGQLFGPARIAKLWAGVDRDNELTFVDVSDFIHPAVAANVANSTTSQDYDTFELGPRTIEFINGAPLSLGEHTLKLYTEDVEGKTSPTLEIDFLFNPGAEIHIDATAIHQSGDGEFAYTYSVDNCDPADSGPNPWELSQFSIPLPEGTTVTAVVSPAGWTVDVRNEEINWVAATGSKDEPGATLEFGFRTSMRFAPADASIIVQRGTGNTSYTTNSTTFGPLDGTGAALYDRFAVAAGDLLEANLLTNDLDDALSVTSIDQLNDWETDISWSTDGSITYDASTATFAGLAAEESIVDRFWYSLTDGSAAYVDVVVTGVNNAPVASDDLANPIDADPVWELHVYADEMLEIPFDLLLANDTDPDINDRSHLTVNAVTPLTDTLGTPTLDPENALIKYDPTQVTAFQDLPAGMTASDRFEYSLQDSAGATDTAIVQIRVLSATNLAPDVVQLLFEANENEILNVGEDAGLLSGVVDPDGIPVRSDLQVEAETVTSLAGSVIETSTSGAFSYDPNDVLVIEQLSHGQIYNDEFDYQVLDDRGGTAVGRAIVTVRGVNDAPIARFDAYSGANEDSIFTGHGLLQNDEDVDVGDTLIVVVPGEPVFSTQGALVQLFPDGTFQYDPRGKLDFIAVGDSRKDFFEYTITDNHGGFSSTFVKIIVEGANDPPSAVDQAYTTRIDVPLHASVSTGLLKQDVDVDRQFDADGNRIRTNLEIVEPDQIVTTRFGAEITIEADGSFVYDARNSDVIRLHPNLQKGLGLPDSFEYYVQDDHGLRSVEKATATIVVRQTEATSLTVVAQTGGDEYVDLGRGPSLNNDGDIAFTAAIKNDKGVVVDSVYVWDPEVDTTNSLIADGFLNSFFQPTSDFSQIPSIDFTDFVQINDRGEVITNRNGKVDGILQPPNLFFSLSVLSLAMYADTQMILTSQELWGAEQREGQRPYEYMPYNVATGDMGFYGAGGIWNNSFYLAGAKTLHDLWGPKNVQMSHNIRQHALKQKQSILAGITGVGSTFFGAYVGATQAAQDPDSFRPQFLPLGPFWAGLLYSPMDIKTAFQVTYPQVALNNEGLTVSAAKGSAQFDGLNYLLTTPHNDYDPTKGTYQFGVGTPGFIASPKIADNGKIVVRNESSDGSTQIYVVRHNLDLSENVLVASTRDDQWLELGAYPAITDKGDLIVFTGKHIEQGPGLFVANPATGEWMKVAGQSEDEFIDPGEFWTDKNLDEQETADEYVGKFKTIPIDSTSLDPHLGINWIPGQGESHPYYRIAFMAESTTDIEALYTLDINPFSVADDLESRTFNRSDTGLAQPEVYLEELRVLAIGETHPAIDAKTPVSKISVYDTVNNRGEVVMHVSTANAEAIVSTIDIPLDLSVDSNNDGEIDETVGGNDDLIEAEPDLPGKFLEQTAWKDQDGDGIVDYRDYHIKIEDPVFTPVKLSVDAEFYDYCVQSDDCKFTFQYDKSVPDWDSASNSGDRTAPPRRGELRLWTVDGNESRTQQHFLKPGSEYSPTQLGFQQEDAESEWKTELYVEGVLPNENWKHSPILVQVTMPDGAIRGDTITVSQVAYEHLARALSYQDVSLEQELGTSGYRVKAVINGREQGPVVSPIESILRNIVDAITDGTLDTSPENLVDFVTNSFSGVIGDYLEAFAASGFYAVLVQHELENDLNGDAIIALRGTDMNVPQAIGDLNASWSKLKSTFDMRRLLTEPVDIMAELGKDLDPRQDLAFDSFEPLLKAYKERLADGASFLEVAKSIIQKTVGNLIVNAVTQIIDISVNIVDTIDAFENVINEIGNSLADIIADLDPRGAGYAQYSHFRDELLSWANRPDPVDITGHSLGGALTQWLAADLTSHGTKIGDVYTYNSPGIPRTGSGECATNSDEWPRFAQDFCPQNAGFVLHSVPRSDLVPFAGNSHITGSVDLYDFPPPPYGLSALLSHTVESHSIPFHIEISPESGIWRPPVGLDSNQFFVERMDTNDYAQYRYDKVQPILDRIAAAEPIVDLVDFFNRIDTPLIPGAPSWAVDFYRFIIDRNNYIPLPPEGQMLRLAEMPPHASITHAADDPPESISIERVETFLSELTLGQPELLKTIEFRIGELPEGLLGLARDGSVTIDDDAAGYGWFVDVTPWEDSEFDEDGVAIDTGDDNSAVGRVDLLTVILHELGHLAGADHVDDVNDLMYETLSVGVRQTNASSILDQYFEHLHRVDSEETHHTGHDPVDDALLDLLAERERE